MRAALQTLPALTAGNAATLAVLSEACGGQMWGMWSVGGSIMVSTINGGNIFCNHLVFFRLPRILDSCRSTDSHIFLSSTSYHHLFYVHYITPASDIQPSQRRVAAATAAATAARLSLNDVSRACFEAGAALCTLGPVLPQPPRHVVAQMRRREFIIFWNDCNKQKK